MNIDLKEIRKMVTTALIQERVGYYDSGVATESDVGEIAEAPEIDAMVEQAEEEMSNLEMSKTNIAQAAMADTAEKLAGPLVQAGVNADVVKGILNDLYSKVMDEIEMSKEEKTREAEVAKSDIESPATGE